MLKTHFIFDEGKCVGCEACTIACMIENGYQEYGPWRKIYTYTKNKESGPASSYLSMACNHCTDAPCMKHCPSLAFHVNEQTGDVLHEPDKCIGCSYCIWNCPYEATVYDASAGIIKKCNFCNSRLLENNLPACVESCPTKALDFTNEQADSAGLEALLNIPQLQHKPSVILKQSKIHEGPEYDRTLLFVQPFQKTPLLKTEKIGLQKEWPLLLFSLICIFQLAFSTLDVFLEGPIGNKIIFLSSGMVAAILSLFHLGHKLRAWRAVLNLSNSWLSREIFFFILFNFGLFTDMFIFGLPNFIHGIIGICLLLSIDKVYKPLQQYWPSNLHADQTIFIAMQLLFILHDMLIPLILILILRLFLLVVHNFNNSLKPKLKTMLRISRILFFILVPLFLCWNLSLFITIPIIVLSELTGRITYYAQLEQISVSELLKKANN